MFLELVWMKYLLMKGLNNNISLSVKNGCKNEREIIYLVSNCIENIIEKIQIIISIF